VYARSQQHKHEKNKRTERIQVSQVRVGELARIINPNGLRELCRIVWGYAAAAADAVTAAAKSMHFSRTYGGFQIRV